MKKTVLKIIALIMSVVLTFTAASIGSGALETEKAPVTDNAPAVISAASSLIPMDSFAGIFAGMEKLTSFEAFGNNVMKVIYNGLNVVVEILCRVICAATPNPKDWKSIDEYSAEESCFLPGRSTYQTEAGRNSRWSLGYSSRSILPDDVGEGRYYIGRDVTPRIAEGVYDDQRIRVCVIDDNSGEGAVVFGAIDSLGVTSADVRSIRAGVLDYCKEKGIKVSSINIGATHAHTALDVQGVGTAFFYKLFLGGLANIITPLYDVPMLRDSNNFKSHFINESIEAVKEAFEDMENGRLYYDTIDGSYYMRDKRDLITKDEMPMMPSLYFVPDSGSESTYITEIGCHPTSFSADNMLVSSDYIYYLDEYIKENTGSNVIIVQGALGQITRDNIEYDESELSDYEKIGAETKALGEAFADLIINGDYTRELDPIINVKHRELFMTPENSLLRLACEIQLVNNKIYYLEDGSVAMATELGYLEFGNVLGFAMFPGEFYPETFWGNEITENATWDGTEWQYPSMHTSVEGIEVYPISLMNDATGYVVPDNNFAFMGHIANIKRSVADELLSVGKHTGSYLIGEYLKLVEEMK